MKLEGDYTFNAPRKIVWDALHDTEVLASIMPGTEILEPADTDNKYNATMKIKVGPVQGVFKGSVALSEINEPDSYHMDVDGQGAPGFVKGVGDVTLEAVDDNTTIMHYTGDANVGGRLASVGQRLIETSAKAIVRQSLEGLQQIIEAKASAASSGGDAQSAEPVQVDVKAPTQTDYAKSVAKEVASELGPKPAIIVGGIAVIAVIILVILRVTGGG